MIEKKGLRYGYVVGFSRAEFLTQNALKFNKK